SFEEIDAIIDAKIDPKISRETKEGLQKAEALAQIEADIAEVGVFLGNYGRTDEKKYKALIFENEKEFLQKLTAFKRLSLTEEEMRLAGTIGVVFNRMMGLSRELLAIDDAIRTRTRRFIALRREIDQILDQEVQLLTMETLRLPQKEADAATTAVVRLMSFLIPLFVLSAIVVRLLLIRLVMKPVTSLLQETENRKKAEAEQARLQASLRRSETMSALGALVSGVSHEVRNPLFGITSTLDAMEARFREQKEYRPYLDVLREQSDRLSSLVQELLEYGKPLNPARVSGTLNEVISEAVRACALLARQRKVEIIDAIPMEMAPVLIDTPRLVQVFQNLLENAIQQVSPGGRVTLGAEEADQNGESWIQCTLQDTGPGFKPEDLPHIFEPFFTRRRGGTGLGLSIVQRIVEDHGGVVFAENHPEGGAVVTVRLPALRRHGERPCGNGVENGKEHPHGRK
ncbi:MAG: ATP-binding protein, partial [Candidatus Manganitrophaceae bacterium]